MVRSLSAFVVLAAAAVAALAPSCNAQVTESCSDGPCGGGAASVTVPETGPNAADCPATPQTGDFPCAVFAVVHKKCNPCHQMPPLNGAPFPLLTYADTQSPYSNG